MILRKSTLLLAVAAASLGLSTSAVLVAQPAETPASDNAATPATPATPADPATDKAATPATPATPAAKADDPLAPTADEVKAEKAKTKTARKKAAAKTE